MKKYLSALVLVGAVVLSLAAAAHAAVPQTINYQGYLTDTSGTPLTGSYEMVFSLCDAATGGSCPWTETKSVSVNKGILSVVLGSVTPITLSFDVQYYLDIQVGGEQMTTRQPLTSVGYAFRAKEADAVAAGSITNSSISDTAGIDVSKVSGLGSLATKSTVTSADITNGTILDEDISDAAGIQASKISGLGSLATKSAITNADVAAGAGIVDTKLATVSTAGKVANSATTATSANTADAIVARDASGNFSAGTITANLSGNATTVTNGVYTDAANVFTTGAQTINTGGGATRGVIVRAGAGQTANLQEWRDANDTLQTAVSPAGSVGVNYSGTPRASLEVGGTDGLLVTGTANSGTVRALGAGLRMHWYPRKGAFRVGMAEGNYWDDNGTSITNMALYSMGMGYQARPTGVASTAIGAYNKATADYALSLGSYSWASGTHSVAIGTQAYATGIYSMAFGSGADTNGMDGAMVIGDDTYFQTAWATCPNQLTMRFSGTDGTTCDAGSCAGSAYRFWTSYPDCVSGVYMNHGQSGWSSYSSRALKENFRVLDGEELLAKIRDMSITEWNYIHDDQKIKYIGPVAEEFHAAFHVNEDDPVGINSVSIDGVNMAGVQALEKRTREMQAEIDMLRAEIESLKAQLSAK